MIPLQNPNSSATKPAAEKSAAETVDDLAVADLASVIGNQTRILNDAARDNEEFRRIMNGVGRAQASRLGAQLEAAPPPAEDDDVQVFTNSPVTNTHPTKVIVMPTQTPDWVKFLGMFVAAMLGSLLMILLLSILFPRPTPGPGPGPTPDTHWKLDVFEKD